MAIYRTLYGKRIEPQLLARDTFHGSLVRDLLIDLRTGSAIDDQGEKLLRELVAEGVLEVLERAPSHGQAAWSGLQYSKQGYRDTPWGPGTAEHYMYRVINPDQY
jgi:hypothetical protein